MEVVILAKQYVGCRECRYAECPKYIYPCVECNGKNVPVTCKDCRYYGYAWNKKGVCKKGCRPCKEFEWS